MRQAGSQAMPGTAGAPMGGGTIDPQLAMALGALQNMGATRDIGGGYRQRDSGAMLRGAAGAGMQAFQDRARLEDVAAQRVRDSYQRQQMMGREDARLAEETRRYEQGQLERMEDRAGRELDRVNSRSDALARQNEETRRYDLGRVDKLADMAGDRAVEAFDQRVPQVSDLSALRKSMDNANRIAEKNQIAGDLAGSYGLGGGIAKRNAVPAAEGGVSEEEWLAAYDAVKKSNPLSEPSSTAIKAEVIRRKSGQPAAPSTPGFKFDKQLLFKDLK